MDQPIDELIEQIAAAGAARNLTRVDIARAAGLADQTLSRAKQRPNIGLQNFSKLANVVGLKLALIADDPVLEKIATKGLFER